MSVENRVFLVTERGVFPSLSSLVLIASPVGKKVFSVVSEEGHAEPQCYFYF